MKIALVGSSLHEIEEHMHLFGLERDDANPDAVIANGGDGSLLGAERAYPGIPKLGLRDSKTCTKCPEHRNEILLQKLALGELVETPIIKLEACIRDTKILGINDIILHSESITSSVRYRVDINGRNHSGVIIGDGLVVATPFGSSAYYRSITHSIFQVGIGLAFNNSTEQVDHLVLQEDCEIDVTILRGPALVAADNNPDWVRMEGGDAFSVRKAPEPARILGIDTLRCPHCERFPDVRRPDYLDRRISPSSSRS
jgi:NAD+ kinase